MSRWIKNNYTKKHAIIITIKRKNIFGDYKMKARDEFIDALEKYKEALEQFEIDSSSISSEFYDSDSDSDIHTDEEDLSLLGLCSTIINGQHGTEHEKSLREAFKKLQQLSQSIDEHQEHPFSNDPVRAYNFLESIVKRHLVTMEQGGKDSRSILLHGTMFVYENIEPNELLENLTRGLNFNKQSLNVGELYLDCARQLLDMKTQFESIEGLSELSLKKIQYVCKKLEQLAKIYSRNSNLIRRLEEQFNPVNIAFSNFLIELQNLDILPEYICPITRSIMSDPVFIRDDPTEQRFEGYAIKEWLRKHGTHPTSRAEYTVDQIERDHKLRSEINELYAKKESISTNPSKK